MMDGDAPTVISMPKAKAAAAAAAATTTAKKKESPEGSSMFGKSRYKFWVLAAILLLAFWTMFTSSVTLKWSTGNLTHPSDDLDIQTHDDLDILELEEKEKVVRRMWDLYTHGTNGKLPRFWQQAFEAAYEALASDVPAVRDAAVSEIAKISIRSINLDPFPDQSTPNATNGERIQTKDRKARRLGQ